jgi:hypothetical protein
VTCNETIPLAQAERLTGLPSAVIQTLADCGEISAERRGEQLYVGKSALLGWCRLFAKVLTVVVTRQRRDQIGGGVSARNLVWMAQAGLLTGKDRVRV